ncbi:unnamed protein product [Prorocentrum cordatum]|uniref:C2H2-type domain-containing protein n=1 Tax=Prorocentrum cordatum TaxID=2364126 RepID=A0ABN9W3E8_9DINO|nr:unnamed protein product [Polarella glacialis]
MLPVRPRMGDGKGLSCALPQVHNETAPIKHYIDDSGVCPECLTDFKERFHVVRHLTDKRRPKCRHAVFQKCPRLPTADVQMWEARDCERKRCARQQGSTQIIATGSAITAEGKRVGHVQK